MLPGGIRDIEFSIQALQLINGGKWKDLQTGNTLKAVTILRDKKLLTNDEADVFANAYYLYRKIEHYLQLMNDKQTHNIPKDSEQLSKMSSYLGFADSKRFNEALHENRRAVTKIYQSIMGKEIKVKAKTDISEINFENKKKALQDFTFLREGKGLLGQKEYDERTISAFQTIESDIISYLKNAISPDSALQNFVRIIKHSNIPFVWYKELTDRKLLISLLTVCEFAQRTIDLFAEDSEIVELLLNRKVFERIDPKTIEQCSLKRMVFTLAVQFTVGISDHAKVSKTLSQFCKSEINRIFNESFNKSHPKLEYFVAGLGSFSIEEMTFNSDIDLVFVIRDLKILPNAEKLFQDILGRIRKSLFPIAVDCRLRPEGKSSLLVWDIKNYDTYIQKRLRIWELQAFTKISLVFGNEKLFAEFLESLQTRLAMESKSLITNEIKEMRKKLSPANIGGGTHLLNIKKSTGGLVDSDFVLQYLALTSGTAFAKFAGKGLKLTSALSKKYFSENDSNNLQRNFSFLKRLDFLNQIMFNASTAILPSDKKKLAMLAKQMDYENTETFRHSLNEVMKSNKLLFQKYVVAH
jgi:glutamate-ammonia-ligase adenylyltransferase